MLNFIKNFMSKDKKNSKANYKKDIIRGTIKELMKNRGLRSISLANYRKWVNDENNPFSNSKVHSIKFNVMNGYLDICGFNENNPNDKRAGKKFEHLELNEYEDIYKEVNSIFNAEDLIPSNIKRNILVKIMR